MKSIFNIVVSIILIAIGIYTMFYIPKLIDFSNVVVRLEDNERIYQFLVYIPLVLTVFNGLLTGGNIFAKNTTLSVISIVLSAMISGYIIMDFMGFRTVIANIGQRLTYVSYANIVCAVLLIAELVISFVLKKKKAH